MRELPADYPEGLAYRTYRVWADFWQARDTFDHKVPPLFHYDNTSRGAALIIAPCSVDEVAAFIASRRVDSDLRYSYESSDLGLDWIGHWSLFRVAPVASA